MNVNKIKEFRDTYKGLKNIDIFLDNSLVLHMGTVGSYVLWDDANNTLTCIRTNQSHILQAESPFEIIVTGYDHIQHMSVRGTVSDIDKYLAKINYAKRKELVKALTEDPANSSSITGSTGDGLEEKHESIKNKVNGIHN